MREDYLKKVEEIIGFKPPDNLVPIHECKCGKAMVWGKRLPTGKVIFLKDEYGRPIKDCSMCSHKPPTNPKKNETHTPPPF